MDNLVLKPFLEIDLKDSFFDSLRANYEGFDESGFLYLFR